jgi:hypothetical protein
MPHCSQQPNVMDKLRQKLGDQIAEPEEGIIHLFFNSIPNAFSGLSNHVVQNANCSCDQRRFLSSPKVFRARI